MGIFIFPRINCNVIAVFSLIFPEKLTYGEKKMNKKTTIYVRRMIAISVILLVMVIGISPVMGMTVIPKYRDVNLLVANDAGVLFNDFGNNTYNFFSENQTVTQGLNALHLSNNNKFLNYGDITFSNAQSGVFYITDTGGRGWDDDGILMIAVNGTVPDNFRVHIKSSGYRWTPVSKSALPSYSSITYHAGAIDEYFTKADFIYGPQIWKPCPAPNYPLFEKQDMTNTTNTFSLMFIDLNAGVVGSGTISDGEGYDGQTVTDNGAIKVEYSFENLQTFAAFDAFAYTVDSNQGQGIRWTNRVTDYGSSGYYVTGQPAPAILPLPGLSSSPTDTNNDGLYDDLNGNGDLDFNDVQLLFRQMDWITANEPVALFDFNHNGEIDFNDIQLHFRSM